VHNHLLPAVRVNTSLRVLQLCGALAGFPDAELAQRIVAVRSFNQLVPCVLHQRQHTQLTRALIGGSPCAP
jgi:hypothetical protein